MLFCHFRSCEKCGVCCFFIWLKVTVLWLMGQICSFMEYWGKLGN